MTRREEILRYLVGLLDHPAKPQGVTVHRYRTRPIEREPGGVRAIVVYPAPQGEQVESASLSLTDKRRKLWIRLEHRAEAAEGEAPDAALDPLIEWSTTRLLEDPTLGGLAMQVEEVSVAWDAVEHERVLGAAAVDHVVTYHD